jgi:hypothetical protein
MRLRRPLLVRFLLTTLCLAAFASPPSPPRSLAGDGDFL